MDAELELRVDGRRQRVDARALREVGHDEVVGRHGKRQQEGRGDDRHRHDGTHSD